MTCFKDDSIFAWESDSLTCKYQLRIPEGKPPNFKDFTTTRDGRLLVGGGRSRYLHVWSLDTHKLQRIIELPKKVTCVRQLAFLADSFDGGSNQVLGVLSQDGIMRFININTCKLLFDVGALDNRISNVTLSPIGRHIVAIMDNGYINVYCVKALSEDLNQVGDLWC
ncbi:hypothetical protein LSH36_1353g00021 [Paralvinella palmiformis]|uniref:Uncharacterized protein n=1 Tax=Paralvinella palmiformis TaxID=53620 RepID=A0AAD9IUP4_9ANNE|nr:hypothetical protein LSH36_1353g00021 [Paralvinella palmiformis]